MRHFLLSYLLLLSTAALAQQPAHRHHQAAGPTTATGQALAYYCASGNTVKYHSSATCRGLNRCSATVKPLTLAEAQSKMQPCRICH